MNEKINTNVVGELTGGKWANMHEQSRRVYGTDGVSPTIHTCGGENIEPKILCVAMRGRGEGWKQQLEVKYDGTTNAITTVQKDNLIIEEERIRKLTEMECFRLMGVDDSYIDKIQSSGISMTQQYKMAGNSIVVDVLYHIFRKLIVDTKADYGTQLELF